MASTNDGGAQVAKADDSGQAIACGRSDDTMNSEVSAACKPRPTRAEDPFRTPLNQYANYLNSGDGEARDPDYLPWDTDAELKSHYSEVYANRESELQHYCRQHPEVLALVNDFMLLVLQTKPDDVLKFAKTFFASQASDPSALEAEDQAA